MRDNISTVIDTLEGWADSHDIWTRHLPDEEAQPHRNTSANYRELVKLLRNEPIKAVRIA